MEAAAQEKILGGAAQAQAMRLQGEADKQQFGLDKQETLLGMSQQRVAAANQARAEAKAAQMSAIGDIGAVGLQMMKSGSSKKKTEDPNQEDPNQEAIDNTDNNTGQDDLPKNANTSQGTAV